MMFKELLKPKGLYSSARWINLGGFYVASIVVLYLTYLGKIDGMIFGAYLTYCAGTYGAGKYLEKKDNNEPTTTTN